MTALPRTTFNSSPLVRLLASLEAASPAPPRQASAERWSQWLDWTDAITLAGVLGNDPGAGRHQRQGRRETPPERRQRGAVSAAEPPAAGRAAASELARVRAELAHGIRSDPAFGPAMTAPDSAALPAWRRHYAARQRAMEERIGPLRAEVRALLSRQSADGARLAALDAVLDKALSARERHLLSGVAQRLAGAPGREGEAPPLDGPLAQAALLAELDLRLQPVEGLVEALAGGTVPFKAEYA